MWQILNLNEALNIFANLMISFAFFVGIMLIVSQEAFEHFNKAVAREMGIKKRILPQIENKTFHLIDFVILKYRLFSGLLIAITSFFLLLIYRQPLY